ncbi:hypothetical protein GYMLUDRAFT_238472 [Collybiopsis luxurians FD-317 M1]|nr:hypothetical protein GYMLUDRAFT_238472 [Collybiopsis luxurians FD-317 M1]
MQATFDAHALKPFTRALSCLSRYGEDLCIYASAETLSLFCTNSSKSAYCRFKFSHEFFSRYRVGDPAKDIHDTVVGQLMTKSLLSILKHKTVESTLEKCEISIAEDVSAQQGANADDESRDGLESKLVVRLHCKHGLWSIPQLSTFELKVSFSLGVIKTHKLLLQSSTTLMAPGPLDPSHETLLTIGPGQIRRMIEQFPLLRGSNSDPQLIWTFGETDVEVKSLESSIDTKSKVQLATELTIPAEEFDVYNLYEAPTTIAFHLREFNATIAFAELSSLGLDIHFTDPAEPLFIKVEGDNFETLFVISTSQPPGAHGHARQRNSGIASSSAAKKRLREDTPGGESSTRFKKPAKAVQPTTDKADVIRDTDSPARSASSSRQIRMQPSTTPSTPVLHRSHASQRSAPPVPSGLGMSSAGFVPLTPVSAVEPRPKSAPVPQPPLFLPDSSQLSILDEQALRESGLGIEHMTEDEFNEMIEGMEGMETDEVTPRASSAQESNSTESFELMEDMTAGEQDDLMLAATQHPGVTSNDHSIRAFYPLFED